MFLSKKENVKKIWRPQYINTRSQMASEGKCLPIKICKKSHLNLVIWCLKMHSTQLWDQGLTWTVGAVKGVCAEVKTTARVCHSLPSQESHCQVTLAPSPFHIPQPTTAAHILALSPASAQPTHSPLQPKPSYCFSLYKQTVGDNNLCQVPTATFRAL